MVELWCSVVFVGMVDGGRGAACFRQPMERCSRFDPWMPGRLGVGRSACGLFMVASLLLQRVCWCMVGLFVVGYFLLLPARSRPALNRVLRVKARASRRGLGLVLAGMSDTGFVVLRPGCSRRVVSVRRRRSRARAARRGLHGCPHWLGRLCARRVWVCGCRVVASVTRGQFCCRVVVCAA